MFITVRSRKSIGEVRQSFEEAAAERKFGVLGSHDVGQNLRSKGLVFDRKLYVYEVCNPGSAKKVLDTNVKVAAALPCRVSIYTDGKEVVLETIRPTMLLKMFNEPTLEPTAKEVETVIEEIMKAAAK
ncbi:MAG: DUF302 domain-containing protein [Deltaproteobacteria bacterium]|nr:DUF302 domain-containing protein [Deltaproteobacteria bacterium]